ncbi:MAG: A/G-specific adenine glycosylase [Clostridia bacterium]|nr:A/G-specific adenine glycosylase [Clostridia bacterium]
MKKSEFSFQRIPAPLLSWYQQHKRDLPWRENPTPYRVWVSEIMLQQTRVEAVKEYYARFMSALPTVEDLAVCAEEKLLKLWEGLGYYSRVRNMQKTAKILVNEYGGEFPQDIALLKKLPGIGSYTAGAIASIAFGQPTAAVDGNVFRVAARLEENPTVISDPSYRKYLEKELSAVYPNTKEACSAFTQSLFEVGALLCKPQSPECAVCPLKELCGAYLHGTQRDFPVLPQKPPKRNEDVFVFLIETPQGFCIRRREEGVLKGMNEFPSHVIKNGETAENILNEWGMYEFTEVKRQKYTHIFTHIRWNMTCVWVKTDVAPFDAYTVGEITETVSLPTAFRQCLGALKDTKQDEQLRIDV